MAENQDVVRDAPAAGLLRDDLRLDRRARPLTLVGVSARRPVAAPIVAVSSLVLSVVFLPLLLVVGSGMSAHAASDMPLKLALCWRA